MSAREKLFRLGDMTGLVFAFSSVSGRGSLHAADCSVVAGVANAGTVRRKTVIVMTSDVADYVSDALEQGYSVKRCPCCK